MLEWPKELIDKLDEALQDTAQAPNYTKRNAIYGFLDGAACRAVWRAKSRPDKLVDAFFAPYTPIGSMTAQGLGGGFEKFTIVGADWCVALDMLKAFVEAHAEELVKKYQDTPVAYDDLCGSLGEE
jgi:hypothetical protein